jgi:hypothetical protein
MVCVVCGVLVKVAESYGVTVFSVNNESFESGQKLSG